MQVDTREISNKIKEFNSGKDKKYFILTMGCQLNENDSQKIAGMLKEAGYTNTLNEKRSRYYCISILAVLEKNAEDRLLGKLGEVKKIKEERGTIIAIGGCMMQEKKYG